MPFLNEAGFLLQEGVKIETLDQAALNFGMPMGPCRLLDEVGIDVGVKVAKILHHGLGDRAKASNVSNLMSDRNFLGRKTLKGFYIYDEDGKEQGINEEARALLTDREKTMDETEIQMRLFLPMINEASMILKEGIAASPSVVDLSLIFGIGFPPFRGGLLRYADSEGLDRILGAIKRFQTDVDKDRYEPSTFLQELVDSKKKFYDL